MTLAHVKCVLYKREKKARDLCEKVFEVGRNPKPHLKFLFSPVIKLEKKAKKEKKRWFPTADFPSCSSFKSTLCVFVIFPCHHLFPSVFLFHLSPVLLIRLRVKGWKKQSRGRIKCYMWCVKVSKGRFKVCFYVTNPFMGHLILIFLSTHWTNFLQMRWNLQNKK